MKVICENNCVIIKDIEDFDLEQTLECGQCFHFSRIDNNEYIVVAFDKMLHIKQVNKDVYMYNTSFEDYQNVWRDYFDMERDYGSIKTYLMNNDELIIPAVMAKSGIHLLKQQFSETLMSFIISQTKQIPQIKQAVKMISMKFGDYLGEYSGEKFYSFPTVLQLKNITREDFIECRVGFRADYLVEAAKYLTEDMNADYFKDYSYEEAKKELMSIRGVGEKVANCVLLFALMYRNAFPVDVWIKRTMEDIYFKETTPISKINEFAREKYGEFGGYAQQYLFFYGKSSKEAENKSKKYTKDNSKRKN